MKKFNRSTVLKIAAQAVQSSFNNALIRSISLAQLALHGEITESERLEIVGLSSKPESTDAVNYAKYNYAGKLIVAAKQVLNCELDFQNRVKAVDLASAKSMEEFQVVQALKGCFITDQNSWNKAVNMNLTADAKLALEAAKVANAQAKAAKAPKSTKAPENNAVTVTATANSAAPDSATVEAGQAAQAQADTVALAMAALAEALTVKDGIGQLLATLSHVDPAVALVEVVNYHRAEMARMTLELEQAKAQKPARRTA